MESIQQIKQYDQFLVDAMYQSENINETPTTYNNQRYIVGFKNNLNDLKVVISYLKANRQCNINEDPQYRSKHDIIVQQVDPLTNFTSSLVSIDKDYQDIVKEICISQGVSYLILKRAHLNQLEQIGGVQKTQKLQEFFNAYDIIICPHQLQPTLRKILYCENVITVLKNEQFAIHQLFNTLKQLDENNINPQELFDSLSEISKRVEFYKKTAQYPQTFSMNRIENVSMVKVKSFSFQRSIYLQHYSSKCNKYINSKCQWILCYDKYFRPGIKEIQQHIDFSKNMYPYGDINFTNKVFIDTQLIQMYNLLQTLQPQIQSEILLNKVKLFKRVKYNLNYEIPNICSSLTNPVNIINTLPFNVFDINDVPSIENISEQFYRTNEQLVQNIIPQVYLPSNSNQQFIKGYKKLNAVIQMKQNEECLICFNQSKEQFVFGCCGCTISIQCLFQLISNYRIKCPNCRYSITQRNFNMGAFMLDTLYQPVIEMNRNKLNLNANYTLILNGRLFKSATVNTSETLQIVLCQDVQMYKDQHTMQVFYEYLTKIPLGTPIQIYIYGLDDRFVQLYIDLLTYEM